MPPSYKDDDSVPLLSPENDIGNVSGDSELEATKILDAKCSASGEDWTDIRHSDRKKRDRLLPDGIILKLIKKSDYEGFKRVFSNVSFLLFTAYLIKQLGVSPLDPTVENGGALAKKLLFIPLYGFYGFQMQCMAFAGGHELLHGNAFKTKWINTLVQFCVSTVFFEVLWHERIMHKQHHKHTLDIYQDPELTSFYSTEELQDPRFMSVPDSRYDYFKAFINVTSYFKQRLMRLISSSLGIATDYTGTGWSMRTSKDEIHASFFRDMQFYSMLQLTVYIVVLSVFATSFDGVKNLLFWWLVPNLIGYGPINFFRNAEHADCDFTDNQLLNTRTVESNRLIRWLLWETNFHAEHHTYPMVPFYNLPVLHELMKGHIKHSECKTFTSQNWQLVKSGGWIDQQQQGDRS